MLQALWKTVWGFLRKLKTELSYNPVIPFLGIYLGKTIYQKDTCNPMFTASSFITVKKWKQLKLPSKKIDKEDVENII